MDPRPYQTEIIEAVERGWNGSRKQLAVLPTGAGKTIVFSWLARRLLPERTLILAHRDELIDQAIAKLYSATGIRAGREKAECAASFSDPVVVASVQTMQRRLDTWDADHFGMVVCDEAHHVISKQWQGVLRHFDPHARILGVTATPDRGDKKNLGSYFESIAGEVGLFDLVHAGYLAPIKIKSIPIQIDISAVKQSAGDYDAKGLDSSLRPYLHSIVDALLEFAPFRRTLCFLPLIATSREFARIARDKGMMADHVDGMDPQRKAKLAAFAGGDIEMLSNAMLLTEGYDEPGIDCILILRPTRSRPLYSQMVGRGTRVATCKHHLLLLDFLWHHERHSLVRPAHLVASTSEQADIMSELAQAAGGQAELDLEGLASQAQAKREEKLRDELAKHQHRKGELIDAASFCLQHGDPDGAAYEPVMPWESRAITPAQQRILKQARLDIETVRGRGHASRCIDLHFRNQKLTLASPKQRALMARMGHPSPQTATAADARKFFAEMRGRKAA